jgi:hypothetical protein
MSEVVSERDRVRLRLQDLVPAAVATLAREMTQGDRSADRLRAAENILDRAGVPRKAEFTVQDARDVLAARLIQLRDEQVIDVDTYDPAEDEIAAEIEQEYLDSMKRPHLTAINTERKVAE